MAPPRSARLLLRAALFAALAAGCGARSDLGDPPAATSAGGAGGTTGTDAGGTGAGGTGAGGTTGTDTGGAGAGGTGGAPFSCEPGEITPMVTGESGVYSIAAGGDGLFWGTLAGTVERMPLAGGAPSVVATSTSPLSVATDQGRVYWVDGTNGLVVAQDKAGGPPVALANGQASPLALALDEQAVYWVSYGFGIAAGTVSRAAKDGSQMSVLADGLDQPVFIAVDEQAVYFVTWGVDRGIHRIDKATAQISTLVGKDAVGSSLIYGIAARGGALYFTQVDVGGPNGGSGKIASVPSAGGAPTVLVSGIPGPREVIADATHLYWSTGGNIKSTGTLGRAPLAGGPPETLAATPGFDHLGLAQDEKAVYFGRIWPFESPPPPDGASVLRWCKTP